MCRQNSVKNCLKKQETMTNRPNFDELVSVYKALNFKSCGSLGSIEVTVDNYVLLDSLLNDSSEYGLCLDVSIPSQVLTVGGQLLLRIGKPRVGLGLFAKCFDDVLRYPKARIGKRKCYVVDDKWSLGDTIVPEIVERYFKVLSLIELISEGEAYLDKEKCELLVFDSSKYAIPVLYEEKDLLLLNVESLDKLLTRFTDDTHRQQKLTILINSIAEICKSNVGEMSFAKILSQLVHLLERFDDSYRIFVADFSYDKVMDQVENAKLEELTKIHKVFADIQNQVLSIPIATVVIGTQLKATQQIDAIFWVNTSLLVGVWVFAILMLLVIKNQSHTLTSIETELKRREQLISNKYSVLHGKISRVFKPVMDRLVYQERVLSIVQGITIFGLVCAHVMFVKLNIPVSDYFAHVWGKFELIYKIAYYLVWH